MEPSEQSPARVRLDKIAGGWVVRSSDPMVTLRVNGRMVRERVLRDGDIIGCGRSLFRIDLFDERPAATPRRTITLDEAASYAPRKKGLSTIVTGPGQWGSVFARWYGGAVLHMNGPADPRPDQLVARLGQRVRCHALVLGDSEVNAAARASSELTNGMRLVPLDDPQEGDSAFIRHLWNGGAFFGVLSPLEPQVLANVVRPLSPLLAYPAAVRSLLSRPEAALVEGLRSADAALLLSRPDGWELYCCPEMLPLCRRLGLPEPGVDSQANYRVQDCPDGIVRIGGDIARSSPGEVASALSGRDSLYLVVDREVGERVRSDVPSSMRPTGSRGDRFLIGPAAGAARFDIIERHWGRGAVLGVYSGREERSILQLAHRLPDRSAADGEPFGSATRERLGGFDAVLYDPADATWAVFADPRPKPVWQRYGLPAPVLGQPG